jgi:hypothetical protein
MRIYICNINDPDRKFKDLKLIAIARLSWSRVRTGFLAVYVRIFRSSSYMRVMINRTVLYSYVHAYAYFNILCFIDIKNAIYY